MALAYADRVKETTGTVGTGTLNLDGAAAAHQDFVSSIGSGNECFYTILDSTAGDWEVGRGTVTSGAPDTLSRDTVLDSSNSGAPVPFASGTKEVFVTAPGSLFPDIVLKDGSVTADYLNFGTATAATAAGDIASSDGTRSMTWDASASTLTIGGGSFSTGGYGLIRAEATNTASSYIKSVNLSGGAQAIAGLWCENDGGAIGVVNMTSSGFSGGPGDPGPNAMRVRSQGAGGLSLVAGSDSGASPGREIRFWTNPSSTTESHRWTMDNDGHFLAASDNTIDIGASGATRPRTGYFGTSIIGPVLDSPGSLTIGGTTATSIAIGRSGITTDFPAGQTVDFTGCTVTGLAGGGEDLAATLAIGNTTGANDISINSGRQISGGRANIGTSTEATVDGEFSAGLTGAHRMDFDQGLGRLNVRHVDAGTTNEVNVINIHHDTSGTVAAGFGACIGVVADGAGIGSLCCNVTTPGADSKWLFYADQSGGETAAFEIRGADLTARSYGGLEVGSPATAAASGDLVAGTGNAEDELLYDHSNKALNLSFTLTGAGDNQRGFTSSAYRPAGSAAGFGSRMVFNADDSTGVLRTQNYIRSVWGDPVVATLRGHLDFVSGMDGGAGLHLPVTAQLGDYDGSGISFSVRDNSGDQLSNRERFRVNADTGVTTLFDTSSVAGLTFADTGAIDGAGAVTLGGTTATSLALGRSGVTTDFPSGSTVDFTGATVTGLVADGDVGILATVTSIDATSTGTTALYTVPVGKTAVILDAIVRCTAATAISAPAEGGVGIAAGEDDIFSSQSFTSLTASGAHYRFPGGGFSQTAEASDVIRLGIDTAATGTSQTLAVDLIGYVF